MKSFKFTTFYDLETKVKALVIIQWNFLEIGQFLSAHRAFEKKHFSMLYLVYFAFSKIHFQICLRKPFWLIREFGLFLDLSFFLKERQAQKSHKGNKASFYVCPLSFRCDLIFFKALKSRQNNCIEDKHATFSWNSSIIFERKVCQSSKWTGKL